MSPRANDGPDPEPPAGLDDARLSALAGELLEARRRRVTIEPPTTRAGRFGLDEAYAVAGELDRRLQARDWARAGVKIGFTNRAIWPRFGLDEPIVAPVYDRTVHQAGGAVSLAPFAAPRLEVEVVFGLGCGDAGPGRPRDAALRPGPSGARVTATPLWVALGFEIVDCHYPAWHLTPADSVADFGLHGALVLGPRVEAAAPGFEDLVARLDELEVRLHRGRDLIATGRGNHVMGHPLAALEAGRRLMVRHDLDDPPSRGWIVSTGTLTELAPLETGERWRVEASGADLSGPELALTD